MKTKHTLKKAMAIVLSGTMIASGLVGCTEKEKTNLNPDNPVTVTVWNYYNGDQLNAFDQLVDEFNSSIGSEKGITVVSVSQGDINTLADSLLDSVEGKAGADDIPTLASVYSETAYILDKDDALVNLDNYFTEDELASYVPAFIDEGRFNEDNELLLFPILKSTEVFTANETDWEDFGTETGYTLENVKTQEDLVAAAKAYYEWTDAKTPDVLDDGKALYGRDSVANYIYLGCEQLGHPMFTVEDGQLSVDMDKATFRTLWDNYYIPMINGYFGEYGKFRSEDAKTGKILAMTSSTASMGYLPDEVTVDDNTSHPITMYTVKSLPFKDAVNDAVVQQGASFCLMKTTEAEQEGAVEFLKWFTDPEQNINFSLESGYSPVTVEANTTEKIVESYSGDTSTASGKNVLDALTVSADVFSNCVPYATKPFNGSKDVRSILSDVLESIAVTDTAAVQEAIASGKTKEEAIAPYITDEYFEQWYNDVCTQVNNAVGAQ